MKHKKLNYILIGILGTLLFIGLVMPYYISEATSTKSRSKDARIIADMFQMQTVAEMIYSDEGSYENVNCKYGNVKILCDDIETQIKNKPTIHKSPSEYCAYTQLYRDTHYCIDSAGRSIETYINPGEVGYCDGKTFLCPKEKGPTPLKKIIKDWHPIILIGIGIIFGLSASILAYFKRKKEKEIKKIKIWSLVWDGFIAPICFLALLVLPFVIMILGYLLESLFKIKLGAIAENIFIVGMYLLYGLGIGFGFGSILHRNKVIGIVLALLFLLVGVLILIALGGTRP